MILTRKMLEERERQMLAPYAICSADSKGREFPEPEGLFRTAFQRDRDRVIHSKAFRRLKGKTQVFVAHYGDHYRSRLTHTMEVAQLSRDLARQLGLNEDLAETLALAHDLGHTPFGHAGQDALNELMREYGDRFEHNEQSRRVVERLEVKRPDHPGLNLTFEVRDGLIKHRTDYDSPIAGDPSQPGLEAQVVNIADEIAYQNHDIDDGLRSGILSLDDLESVGLWKRAGESVDPGLPRNFLIPARVSALIGLMVYDLAENTDRRLRESGVASPDEVMAFSEPLVAFSSDFQKGCDTLKDHLYQHFYRNSKVAEYNRKGQEVIRDLFAALIQDPSGLPEEFTAMRSVDPSHILVKDYIAGMTDAFALSLHQQLAL